ETSNRVDPVRSAYFLNVCNIEQTQEPVRSRTRPFRFRNNVYVVNGVGADFKSIAWGSQRIWAMKSVSGPPGGQSDDARQPATSWSRSATRRDARVAPHKVPRRGRPRPRSNPAW